jgi:hypothetical protein
VPPSAAAATPARQADPGPTAPGPGETDPAARLEQARARCVAELDRRLTTLTRLENATTGAEVLTDAHRASMLAIQQDERDALTGLRGEVEVAPDRATLEPLCRSIATDHRIYRLRVPQAHLTIGFDRAAAATDRLEEAAGRLQAGVDERAAAGEDVTEAQRAVDTLLLEIAAARAGTEGQADALLAVSPADVNADPGLVARFREASVSARGDLRQAMTAAREAARFLRG